MCQVGWRLGAQGKHSFWVSVSEGVSGGTWWNRAPSPVPVGVLQSTEFLNITQQYAACQDFPVAQMVKSLPAVKEIRVRSLGREDPLKKGTAIHSGILARRTPWTEKPGRLQAMGLWRVGHNLVTNACCMLGHFSHVRLCNPLERLNHQHLDLGSLAARTVTFLFFKPPGLWYVVMAAQADKMQASYLVSLFTLIWELLHCWGEKRVRRERMRCWRRPCALEGDGEGLRQGISAEPREEGKDLGC